MVLFHASLPSRSSSRLLGNVWTKGLSDLVRISSRSCLKHPTFPNQNIDPALQPNGWLQGCRFPRLQCYSAMLKGSRVPGLKGSKVGMSQGNVSRVQGFLGLQRIDTHKRIVVGKFSRLHSELHLQFPDAQTIWTIETQPKCSISGSYCLNLVNKCWRSHWAEHQRDDKRITSQMLRLGWGMHKRGAEGWHCPRTVLLPWKWETHEGRSQMLRSHYARVFSGLLGQPLRTRKHAASINIVCSIRATLR